MIIHTQVLINGHNKKKQPAQSGNVLAKAWYEKTICGLDKEGEKRLFELKKQLRDPGTAYHVDRKLVRYLEQLKNTSMKVPSLFKHSINPRTLYRNLLKFCQIHDIPEEIIAPIIPVLINFITCGHMRPVIFVGDKGCGKTTAVKLLVEEALQLPTEVIKIPQTDGGHGMIRDSGSYMAADVGYIAKARLRANSLIVAYIIDEIDKVCHERNRANVDDELLSITDESCVDIIDNYLETSLVGLEHCPMFFTANDLQKVSPILVDRCSVIRFPNANAERLKSISRKYINKQLGNNLYSSIQFNYELMDKHIDNLIKHNVTSIRKHQQMIELVLENALSKSLI